MTFLVEVNWARGRLMREYTVLLDPPVYTPGENPNAAAPVTAPTTAAAPPAPATPRAPAPRAPAPAAAPAPSTAATTTPLPTHARSHRTKRHGAKTPPAPAAETAAPEAAAPAVSRAAPLPPSAESANPATVTGRQGRYADQDRAQPARRYAGGRRSNHDRSVSREPGGVRRQHQHFAPAARCCAFPMPTRSPP